jgi:AcrR family transcriptional regulator
MRREELLDAAIAVLGTTGMHGLTHRRVDAAAGVPAGSASNHFRSREALLDAVVVRFAERDRRNWEAIAGELRPTTPEELAATLVAFAHAAVTEHRELTLARYAILVEAGIQPSLRARLLSTGSGVNAWFLAWLRLAGSREPELDLPILMNHWTGVVLHEIAIPDPAFDPSPQINRLVASVLGAGVRS